MSLLLNLVAVVLVAVATVLIGAYGLRSRSTSDFFVASRSVSPLRNAAAVGGEYLSAASYLGIAGLVLAFGAPMLWYGIGYTAGFLVLLVFVAAPLRRCGAYTVSDFAEARLGSLGVRRVATVLVVLIGWLYQVPQLQAAGLALRAAFDAPAWAGALLVSAVVLLNVVASGMRSVTLVQAFHFWFKLAALAVPALVMVLLWSNGWHLGGRTGAEGAPAPSGDVAPPLPPDGGPALYSLYSLMAATFFGAMGLPHVIARFYTNPDGRTARRTAVSVLGLLGVFYLLPAVYGGLGRLYASELVADGRADAVVVLLPSRLVPGVAGELLTAVVIAGAFAAFLSVCSGLTLSVASVLCQDVFGGGVRGFRKATAMAATVPCGLALLLAAPSISIAQEVGLVFAIAASSFCPLLVLGIWWRRLTAAGAVAGMLVGGGLATTALVLTLLHWPGPGWLGTLIGQPAAWTVPTAFLTMIVVSLATRSRVPPGTSRALARLHLPETPA